MSRAAACHTEAKSKECLAIHAHLLHAHAARLVARLVLALRARQVDEVELGCVDILGQY